MRPQNFLEGSLGFVLFQRHGEPKQNQCNVNSHRRCLRTGTAHFIALLSQLWRLYKRKADLAAAEGFPRASSPSAAIPAAGPAATGARSCHPPAAPRPALSRPPGLPDRHRSARGSRRAAALRDPGAGSAASPRSSLAQFPLQVPGAPVSSAFRSQQRRSLGLSRAGGTGDG